MIQMFKKVTSNIFNNKNNVAKNPIIIVDIGCRWGFADKFINDLNNIFIYGFDPDKEECLRLKNLYEGKNNIQLIPIGLADVPGKRQLYLTSEPACSSLYKPDSVLTTTYPALDCAREVSQIEVEVSTLDIWVEQVGITYIDYIKIDTQGAEFAILNGALSILKTVKFLEIEVEFNPIYTNQPIFSDIDLFLRQQGFVLWKFSNFVHYGKTGESDLLVGKDSINFDSNKLEYEVRGGQIYWADAYYIRKEIVDVNYDMQSTEQIFRDAKLAHRLGFIDLEYRLMKEYDKRISQ